MKRFRDDKSILDYFTDIILIHCPKCNEKAELYDQNNGFGKTVCKCGYFKVERINLFGFVRNDCSVAPIMIKKLWLQKEYKGNLFWATNYEHLAFLKEYIQAEIRERIYETDNYAIRNQTMISRLPQFIKSRKNRDDLLKIISQLENK